MEPGDEKIDMRTARYEIAPQEVECFLYNLFSISHVSYVSQILTKDSMTMFVNAIMYYKVAHATSAIANVDNYSGLARVLAATTLRNVLGTK